MGATIYLGAAAKAEYAFTPMRDGDTVEFGRVRLKVLETPGHTPESISIVVYDLNVSDTKPNAVLTGDTLFIGDVGRPDLRAALGWSATQLGGLLFDSVHDKLLTLPDESLVYPAHGAGSLCGKAISKETVSTLGEQRRLNYALQPMSKEAFIQVVTADQPEAPAYFNYDAVRNSEERPTLDEALAREMNPLTLDAVLALQAEGAQILDTRDADEFAAAHLKGSINIGLGGQYATWVGTVLNHANPIVIIADPGRENESAIRLGRIGFDHVAGYLEEWIAQPQVSAGIDRLHGAAQRAICFGTAFIEQAAAGHRRSRTGRARTKTHRWQPEHSAQPPAGKSENAAERSLLAGLLRWRLPLVHCREPFAARRICFRWRNCGRPRGVGIRQAAGSRRQRFDLDAR